MDMSIMILFGNNKTATIYADCRMTCTMKDGTEQYYEDAQKVFKFNKTIIGVIGDAKYASAVIDDIRHDSCFKTKREFINAKYELIHDLCYSHFKNEKHSFENSQCIVGIVGINKENKIVVEYFNTDDFRTHKITPEDSEFATKTFCNYNEENTDQAIYHIINTSAPDEIIFNIHNYLCENNILYDKTINEKIVAESVSL